MAVATRIWIWLCIAFLPLGCKSVQHISNTRVSTEAISQSTSVTEDEEIVRMIAPYKVKLDDQMHEVLGEVSQELSKKKPESTLGNWFSDAMLSAALKFDPKIDFAIANYGGLRIPSLSAGPLLMGEIYELCPFDNEMVIVEIPGAALDSFLQMTAQSEGWPVSNGIRMIIKDKRMISCYIQGKPLDANTTYKVAMSDYVANGGDNMSVLTPLERTQTGIVIRDALIAFTRETTSKGMTIKAIIEGRIIVQ